MDRRKFLVALGAAGAALYLPSHEPKRSYFFGGWPAGGDLMSTLRNEGFRVDTRYLVDEVATGVVVSRPMKASEVNIWYSLGAEALPVKREIYVALVIDDIAQAQGDIAHEYAQRAKNSLNNWDPVLGYAEYQAQLAAFHAELAAA